MKILDFTSNPEYYSIIYEGLCATSRGFQGAETRTVSKIFDKLEMIGQSDDKHLYHIPNGLDDPIIKLEDHEFELLVAAFNHVQWNAFGARKAAGTYEFLLSVAQRTNGE